jgi:hypothetical protein
MSEVKHKKPKPQKRKHHDEAEEAQGCSTLLSSSA